MESNDRQLLWIADNLDDLSTSDGPDGSKILTDGWVRLCKRAARAIRSLTNEHDSLEAENAEAKCLLMQQARKISDLNARVNELESQLAHCAPPNLYPMGFVGLPYSEQPTSNVPQQEQGQ